MKKTEKRDRKNPEKIIKIVMNVVLIAFIVVSIVYAIAKTGIGKTKTKTLDGPVAIVVTPAPAVAAPVAEKGKVILYYLHSTGRCHNCILMEQYAKEAVDKYFQKQVKNGELEFRMHNFDEPENRHFIQDYQLITKSLVISLVKDGKEQKYENLKGIWEHVRNQEGYHRYVKSNVDKYLQEAK